MDERVAETHTLLRKRRFAMGLFLSKCFYQELELLLLKFMLLFALFTPSNLLTVGLLTSFKTIMFSLSVLFLAAPAPKLKPFAIQISSFHIQLTKLHRKLFHIFVSVTMICLSQFFTLSGRLSSSTACADDTCFKDSCTSVVQTASFLRFISSCAVFLAFFSMSKSSRASHITMSNSSISLTSPPTPDINSFALSLQSNFSCSLLYLSRIVSKRRSMQQRLSH